MKKFISIITLFAICLCVTAQQQCNQKPGNGETRREFNPELYKKDMIKFVTANADLTEAEAASVFPIINELHEKQHNLMRQHKEMMLQGMSDNLSEAEYEKMITKSTEIDVEIKKLDQTYFNKLHSVLSWKKIYAVRIALNRFQMEALKRFRPDRRNQSGNAPKGGTQKKN